MYEDGADNEVLASGREKRGDAYEHEYGAVVDGSQLSGREEATQDHVPQAETKMIKRTRHYKVEAIADRHFLRTPKTWYDH
ncbi:hypothetical protein GN244_ATG02160 [Phytophthora infestans]|uniref:Uncharacterized protein n=1 Tax=Phytophthora infestans TaxID=4787 RepID=A0A833SC34_PHYIN|nr:hypothetical protein GN244_ATG02160 [Phytophthora infestans]KAF4139290.1 hypothetical protein GN958_ATG11506 [Phytophthora infestans]